jgi:predicted peptidase
MNTLIDAGMVRTSLPPDPLSPDYVAVPQRVWEEKFTAFEFKLLDVNGYILPYRFYRPAHLEMGRDYPLVVFFHGVGERGVDNRVQLQNFASVIKFWEKYPCFIVAPLCPPNALWVETAFGDPSHSMQASPSWPMKMAMDLLDKILKEQPVDTNRVYLTGLSMGGFATWDIPTKFAAAVPICGGADLALAPRLSKVPVWVFHGDADQIVPPKRS